MTPAQTRIKRWREDPVLFVREELKVEPDPWQVEALKAFASRDKSMMRISLQACAGPGKSAVLAWCGLNFLACYGEKGEHPKGAAVSITQDNLKDNLWPEFSKWQSRSDYLMGAFTWTKEQMFSKSNPATWFISARSWSKTANPDEQGRTLSGLHSKYVLCLIDESGEIPTTILKAGEQALGNCQWGKIMQAGNPTSHDGMLYAAATTLRHLWHVIRITGDPEDRQRSTRIDSDWAAEQIKTYGREDPWVMAYILGMFPPDGINTLLGVEEVESAMKRAMAIGSVDTAQRRLGIDVARGGLDKTVLFPRQGLQAFTPVKMSNAKGHEVAARAMTAKEKWDWEMCFIDDTGGYGGSVCDSFIQAGVGHIPVNFSGSPIDGRYFNKRSEMWFEMAKWVKRGGCLPNIPGLSRELTTPTYSFHNGKFRLEEKDQIKKRLGFSPDNADALALTFAMPEMPRGVVNGIEFKRGNNIVSDWNPYREFQDTPRADTVDTQVMV